MLRAAIFCFFLLFLESCATQFQRLAIDVNQDNSANFRVTLKSFDDGKEAVEKTRNMAQDCGLSFKTFSEDKIHIYDFSSKDASNDDLEAFTACYPASTKPKIKINRTEGLFYDDYSIKVNISRPTISLKYDKDLKRYRAVDDYPEGYFPAYLDVSMPGTIIYNYNNINILGFTSSQTKSENRIITLIKLNQSIRNKFQNIFEKTLRPNINFVPSKEIGKIGKLEFSDEKLHNKGIDNYEIIINSRKIKIGINEILSIFGILFGSGLIIELSRKVFRVKVENRAGV